MMQSVMMSSGSPTRYDDVYYPRTDKRMISNLKNGVTNYRG